MKVTEYASTIIDPLGKGLGKIAGPRVPLIDGGLLNWNLLNEDVSLPAAVLYEDRIKHNLDWMQAFATNYGIKLAPHGKTTMAPRLFRKQLETGAWGITLATAPQAQVAYRGGVSRILLANQLVGQRNMEIIAELLEDPKFEFFCLVDSVEGVNQLGAHFQKVGKPLNVLLELGVRGGRTGVRNNADQQAVLEAISCFPDVVQLAGVEIFEGLISDEADIKGFLRQAVDVTQSLIAQGLFARKPPLLSGAGSSWYDMVAEEFTKAFNPAAVDIVLRPGCYLTHDVGHYKKVQKKILARNIVARRMNEGLLPALQLWSYVQSIPEPDLAIVSFGKRDVSFDAGMPEPALHFRRGWHTPRMVTPERNWEVFRMMDQHAFMHIPSGDDVKVGDMIAFDISHPCLTFDKWRQLLIVDANYQVVEVVETFF